MYPNRTNSRLKASVLALVGLVLCSTSIRSQTLLAVTQPASTSQAPAPKRIVLTPSKPGEPSFRHQLLPTYLERRSENASVFYGKVTAEQANFFSNQEMWRQVFSSLEKPLEELTSDPQLEITARSSIYRFLRLAACCNYCDWQLPTRDGYYFSMLLPEIQQCRQFARLLLMRARLQIAQKDFAGAELTLQDGYALARNAAEAECVVAGLVGVSIEDMMNRAVLEFIQQPDAPNLYWALSALPAPLVDLHSCMEADRAGLELTFDVFRHLDEEHGHGYWTEHLRRIWSDRDNEGLASYYTPDEEWLKKVQFHPDFVAALAVRGYPIARRSLVDQGLSPADVDKMSVAQVILLHSYQQYRLLSDMSYQAAVVPYPESAPYVKAYRDRYREELSRGESLPLSSIFITNYELLRESELRTQREVAFLILLEALRWYGAAHDGKLPVTLDDLGDTVVPNDPVTRQPFVYRVEGDTAFVTGPTLPFRPINYEIQFAPALTTSEARGE